MHLGIFRSDYLLHAPEASNADTPLALKQVEFNTISSSFGALSERTSGLHKSVLGHSRKHADAHRVKRMRKQDSSSLQQVIIDVPHI